MKKGIAVLLFLFAIAVLPAHADVIFSEDFEAGGGGWGADNGVWQVGTPTAGPSSCYGGTQCAGTVLGGDYPSKTDSRLISPSVTLSTVTGTEELHLRFQNWFSYTTSDSGQVQISVWDAGTSTWGAWTNEGAAVADTSGVWTIKDVDLTAYAGGKVRIGFYHAANIPYESTGWYIDDVQIVAKVPTFTGTFEGGWGDWGADRGVWQIGVPTVGPPSVPEGTQLVGTVLGGNYPSKTDSRLISPTVTLSTVTGTEELHLRFQNWFSYTTSDSGQVQISVWDASTSTWGTWTNEGTVLVNSSGGWTIKDVDLTAYAGGKVRIGFYHATNVPYESTGWYIDDVTITPPKVTKIDSVDDSGDGSIIESEVVAVAVTQVLVSFSQAVVDPAGDTAANDVTNPANYLLFEDGANSSFDTVDCAGGVVGDDAAVTVDGVSYDSGGNIATLSINGGATLGDGSYRLHVCGSTSIENSSGGKLDGDGNGAGGDDFIRNFSVLLDTDGDGDPDYSDPDDDNDGAPDTSEIANGTDPKDANDWPQPFADMTNTHAAYTSSLVLSDAGIVTGCGGGNFCPEMIATRDLAAIWLIKAAEGGTYTPPGATGTVFSDVGTSDFNAAWIEDLSTHQITTGCGGGNYCPKQAVSKDQAAQMLLKARYGIGYAPGTALGGVYADVGVGDFAADWIEDMANKGFAEGCGGGNYCPEDSLTLAGFAKLLAKTFGLVP